MEDKIMKIVREKKINIQSHAKQIHHYQGHSLLPPKQRGEPQVGEFCRSIVIGKDEAKKELILHLTFLLEEANNV